MSLSLPPFSNPTETGDPQGALSRIRAEIESQADERVKGILLYEAAVLEQRNGNDAQAVRDLLAAVNGVPDFIEPLERLVSIIERRKSYKNLGKLLDRLCRVTQANDARSRARWTRAAFLEDQVEDRAQALSSLQEAIEVDPSDPTPHLFLELLAAHLGDAALRRTALQGRAELATDPTWKALLLIDLAGLLADDDPDGAIGALERAVGCKGPATFAAVEAMAALGQRHNREEVTARALEATASLIMRAVADGAVGDALGVRPTARTVGHAADAWLRASEAHRRRGDVESAKKLLDRAREQAPGEPALASAALRLAEAAGDTEATRAVASSLLEQGATGGQAASLWLRIAEASAADGDGEAALDALGKALEEDASCIPARALQLDLLTATGDAAAFADALGQAMGRMNSPASIAATELLVADTLAREAASIDAAREAIQRSIALDPSAARTAHRVGRALAIITGDATWEAQAVAALLGSDLPSVETAGLLTQAVRQALLSTGDAGAALDRAAEVPVSARFAAILRAVTSDPESPSALATLAETESNAARARALRLVAAWLAVRQQQPAAAHELVSAIGEEHPGDIVAATARATLHHRREEYAEAAAALEGAAAAADDSVLGLALGLEAALLKWRGGDRDAAVESLSRLSETTPEVAGPVLAWALRAARPDDLEARRSAVDATAAGRGPSDVALELLTLDLAAGADPAASLRALTEANPRDGSRASIAASLAEAIAADDAEQRHEALLSLAGQAASSAAVTAAAAHASVLDAARAGTLSHADTLQSSRAWSEAAPCPEAALEWYAAARGLDDLDAQAEALRALGATQDGDVGGALAGAGEIARFIAGSTSQLLARHDASAALADLETSPPGCDPARRAFALDAGAEFLDEDTRSVSRLLVGYNALAAGNAERAAHELKLYTREFPDDLGAWDGLREAAALSGEAALVAEACSHLAEAVDEPSRAAELWEEAATVLGKDLGDVARAELALERAVAADVRRFSSFDTLFRIVRAKKDGPRLLELIAQRLAVAEDPDEIAKLYWERARTLRSSGDASAALEALENVVMLEPDHVGALALSGEIFITEKRFEEAAQQLARLAALREAPNQQRLMSGVAAADLYENKLGLLQEAVGVLQALDQAGLSTPAVRERLARSAAKAERWKEAAAALTRLAHDREEPRARVEAARLAMAIHRDRLEAPADAAELVDLLLSADPGDGEAIDLVLSGAFPADATTRWLARGARATADALIDDPGDNERAKRLAEIAKQTGDQTTRQVALGIQVAAGARDAIVEEALGAFETRAARAPAIALDDELIESVRDGGDRGPLAELFRALAPTLAEALGPGLTALGVGRKERVKPKDGLPLRNEIAAWAGALGVGEFEMYHGGRDPDGIYGVPAEIPVVVAGGNVTSPMGPQHRAAIARELLALRLGTTILRHRDPADVSAIVSAACSLAGVELGGPSFAMQGEFQRQLAKEIPRKVRKLLPDLAAPIVREAPDPVTWARAATTTLDRIASIACGDVSWALVGPGSDRGSILATDEGRLRASLLLRFTLSPSFAAVRGRLGLEAR